MTRRFLICFLCLLGLSSTISRAQTVQTVQQSPQIRDYLALDRATGHVFVSDYQGISRVEPDGTLERMEIGWTFITGLGVAPNGDLIFAETNDGKILRRGNEGGITEIVSGLDQPVGIWMCPSGECLYTQTMREPGVILRVNLSGGTLQTFSGLGAGATDVAMDPDGNFYIAYFNTGVVQKVTPAGAISQLTSLQGFIGYITYAGGSLYATAWARHQILRIDPNTGALEVVAGTGVAGTDDGDALTTAQFDQPNGIAASVTGDTLYVSQNRNRSLRMITGLNPVETATEEVQPAAFALGQSYPNPFRTSTRIPYQVTHVGHVEVAVYDIVGRKLSTLVSGVRAPGSYAVDWAPSGLPAGTYLYRIRAGDAEQTLRMSLVR